MQVLHKESSLLQLKHFSCVLLVRTLGAVTKTLIKLAETMVKAIYLTLGKVTLTKFQKVSLRLCSLSFSLSGFCVEAEMVPVALGRHGCFCTHRLNPPNLTAPLVGSHPGASQPQWGGVEPCWRGLVGSRSREGRSHWDKGEGQAETIDMLYFYVEKGRQVHVLIKAC